IVGIGSLLAGVSTIFNPLTAIGLVIMIVLTSMAFNTMMFLLMVRIEDPLVPRAMFGILNTLLFFPSGSVYPIQAFPRWLRALAKLSPLRLQNYQITKLRNLSPAWNFPYLRRVRYARPMTLLDAKQYDPEKSRKKRNRIVSTILVVVVLAFLAWWFRYWPQERVVGHFFQALQQQDYNKAYGIWMHHPDWQKN